MILRLERQHFRWLKEEARKAHPIEACAILFGKLTSREAVAKKVVMMQNKLQSTVGFEIDPETFVKVLTEAEKEGLDFVGLFHSHPAPAKPSSIDLEYMKLWGDALWLILSSINDKLNAYQMRDGQVKEVTINLSE